MEHMLASHQQCLEWSGNRFRKWAERIGSGTYQVVDAILTSKHVEQQSYRSCMGLLKLVEKYSIDRLEVACRKALSFTATPSYKSKMLYIEFMTLTTTIYSVKITMKVDLCSPQTAHTFCSGPNTRSAGQGGFLKPGHHISVRDKFVSV